MPDLTPAMRVDIRKTHPNLYYAISVSALFCVALGFNFFFTTPTFSPLHIPKNLIGAIFMTLGVTKLVFLNVFRILKLVRLVMACEMAFVFFWALANTQQVWAHKASFQLPLVYLAVSLLELPLLIEPAVNPVSEKP